MNLNLSMQSTYVYRCRSSTCAEYLLANTVVRLDEMVFVGLSPNLPLVITMQKHKTLQTLHFHGLSPELGGQIFAVRHRWQNSRPLFRIGLHLR